MKGIIEHYDLEKGFGFIKDQKGEKRFFHISNIREKQEFLDNITKYYYSDWVERDCYVVDFIPGENEKGLRAAEIILTNHIFNDKAATDKFEAKVVDFKYNTSSLKRIISGIKGGSPERSGIVAGGNGTYRVGYPEVYRTLDISFLRLDDIGWGEIDVRDLVLNINGKSRITDNLVENLKNKLIGQVIKVIPRRNQWMLEDSSILKL